MTTTINIRGSSNDTNLVLGSANGSITEQADISYITVTETVTVTDISYIATDSSYNWFGKDLLAAAPTAFKMRDPIEFPNPGYELNQLYTTCASLYAGNPTETMITDYNKMGGDTIFASKFWNNQYTDTHVRGIDPSMNDKFNNKRAIFLGATTGCGHQAALDICRRGGYAIVGGRHYLRFLEEKSTAHLTYQEFSDAQSPALFGVSGQVLEINSAVTYTGNLLGDLSSSEVQAYERMQCYEMDVRIPHGEGFLCQTISNEDISNQWPEELVVSPELKTGMDVSGWVNRFNAVITQFKFPMYLEDYDASDNIHQKSQLCVTHSVKKYDTLHDYSGCTLSEWEAIPTVSMHGTHGAWREEENVPEEAKYVPARILVDHAQVDGSNVKLYLKVGLLDASGISAGSIKVHPNSTLYHTMNAGSRLRISNRSVEAFYETIQDISGFNTPVDYMFFNAGLYGAESSVNVDASYNQDYYLMKDASNVSYAPPMVGPFVRPFIDSSNITGPRSYKGELDPYYTIIRSSFHQLLKYESSYLTLQYGQQNSLNIALGMGIMEKSNTNIIITSSIIGTPGGTLFNIPLSSHISEYFICKVAQRRDAMKWALSGWNVSNVAYGPGITRLNKNVDRPFFIQADPETLQITDMIPGIIAGIAATNALIGRPAETWINLDPINNSKAIYFNSWLSDMPAYETLPTDTSCGKIYYPMSGQIECALLNIGFSGGAKAQSSIEMGYQLLDAAINAGTGGFSLPYEVFAVGNIRASTAPPPVGNFPGTLLAGGFIGANDVYDVMPSNLETAIGDFTSDAAKTKLMVAGLSHADTISNYKMWPRTSF
jgi:hypothetical protein